MIQSGIAVRINARKRCSLNFSKFSFLQLKTLTRWFGQLSGGQRARLTLTVLALEHDNFLIMDEPTNHLDIEAKEVLEQAFE